jgi:hypothetical protein
LEEVLKSAGAVPDLTSSAKLDWIHRRIGASDVYFVANGSSIEETAELQLRSTHSHGERWDGETGMRYPLAVTAAENGTEKTSVTLGPTESCFVVLRDEESEGLAKPVRKLESVTEVNGPWAVHFPQRRGPAVEKKFDSLTSWSDSDVEAIKHYSGTATYSSSVTIPPNPTSAGRRVFIDLGDVRVMAHVTMNGKDCGIAWKVPFQLDVTGAVHGGENQLRIEVVNLWPNRLIGDAALPEAERTTWSSWEPFKANMALLPSGLLGPVRVMEEVGQ